MTARIPDGEAVQALAEKLRQGGWCLGLHVTLRNGGLYQRRSVVDRRVLASYFVPKRGDSGPIRYVFGDPRVDVPVTPGGPIVEAADARTFDSLEDLAAAILAHDRALAEEREWQAAAPERRRA